MDGSCTADSSAFASVNKESFKLSHRKLSTTAEPFAILATIPYIRKSSILSPWLFCSDSNEALQTTNNLHIRNPATSFVSEISKEPDRLRRWTPAVDAIHPESLPNKI